MYQFGYEHVCASLLACGADRGIVSQRTRVESGEKTSHVSVKT